MQLQKEFTKEKTLGLRNKAQHTGHEMLCIRVLTVFLCPGPRHRAVITSSFAIQVVRSDRDLVALVF